MRSQSQHYHSRPNNLLQRQPLFEDGDLQDNLRQPLKKSAEKSRLMNIPRPYSIPTKPSTTTTVTTELTPLANLFGVDDQGDFEYEDEVPLKEPTKEIPSSQQSQFEKLEDDLADEVEYVKSNANVLDTAKPTINTSDEFALLNEDTHEADQPVILTSNFYLPENVNRDHAEYQGPESESGKTAEVTTHNAADYEYEYEEYEEDVSDSVSGSTSTTTLRTSTTDDAKSADIEESSPLPSNVDVPETIKLSTKDFKDTPKEVVTSALPHSEDEMEVLGEAVVSVVTTKSVINGSTSTMEPDESEFYDEEEPTTQDESQYDATAEKTTSTETINHSSSPSPISSSKKVTPDPDVDYDPEDLTDSLEQNAGNSSTENYLVVASVQTSRSVSGARYLPFPQVEQEEKKQALSELDATSEEEDEGLDVQNNGTRPIDPLNDDSIDPTTLPTIRIASTTEEEDTDVVEVETSTIVAEPSAATVSIQATPISSTEQAAIPSQSTESTIDKLDRVQSELLDRSGLLTGKFPILNEMPDPTSTSTTEDVLVAGTSAPVVIRKFMPRTTAVPRPHKKEKSQPVPVFEDLHADDLTESLLPPGFKPRNNSYRNKKVTTPIASTTSTEIPVEVDVPTTEVHHRSANISRSFKNHPLVQDTHIPIKKEKEKVVEHPKRGYTTKHPFVTVSDSVNLAQFLPPGYKPPKTTKKPQSAVAPPDDFKPISDSSNKKPAAFIPVADNIASFLTPGYQPPAGELPEEIPIADDILRKLLPNGYVTPKTTVKPKLDPPKIHKFSESDTAPKPTDASDTNIVDNILNKIQFKDVSALLPPGFKPEVAATEATPLETTTKAGYKVVFPKGIGKRPGSGRVTTAAPVHNEGPSVPAITIRKGLR